METEENPPKKWKTIPPLPFNSFLYFIQGKKEKHSSEKYYGIWLRSLKLISEFKNSNFSIAIRKHIFTLRSTTMDCTNRKMTELSSQLM